MSHMGPRSAAPRDLRGSLMGGVAAAVPCQESEALGNPGWPQLT